jgi:hypothetical protein
VPGTFAPPQALEEGVPPTEADCLSSKHHIDTIRYDRQAVPAPIYEKALQFSMVAARPGTAWASTTTAPTSRGNHPRSAAGRRIGLNTADRLIRMLKRNFFLQPDLCVATHFLPAEINRVVLVTKGKTRCARHAHPWSRITDVHALWLCRTVESLLRRASRIRRIHARHRVVGPREKIAQNWLFRFGSA